jgi:hypothetical protein
MHGTQTVARRQTISRVIGDSAIPARTRAARCRHQGGFAWPQSEDHPPHGGGLRHRERITKAVNKRLVFSRIPLRLIRWLRP